MKRNWDIHELIEQWTLLPRELELLHNKSGSTRLGYAVFLKFFQYEAKFPNSPREIPKAVLTYVSSQVNVEPDQFRQYDWQSRTATYHRKQIRELCGFRKPTVTDAHELRNWLFQNAIPQTLDIQFLENAAIQHLRELRIESMSLRRLQRVVHAAIRTYEQQLCSSISEKLSPKSRSTLDQLLITSNQVDVNDEGTFATRSETSVFHFLSSDPGGPSLSNLLQEVEKLKLLRQHSLPLNLFQDVAPKIVTTYRTRAATERIQELRRHPPSTRYTLIAAFCWQRSQEVTENLVDLLIEIIHKLGTKAERRVTEELTQEFKRVEGKHQLLYRIACAALENPEGAVKNVIYPVASPDTLQSLVREFQSSGTTYRQRVHKVVRRSYQYHYRRMVPQLLELLEFRSNNKVHQPVIQGLSLLKKYANSQQRHYEPEDILTLDGVLRK